MKERAEQMILAMRQGKTDEKDALELLENLRTAVKENPLIGREYGQLIAQLGNAIKSRPQKADLNLVPIGNGFVAIGHKPGGKITFSGMKAAGVSAIVTLLQENEGAAKIGIGTTQAGMKWISFPFSASKPHEGEDKEKVKTLFSQLNDLLSEGETIYIHCSAGIHRTGMISYGLLRYLGYPAEKAKKLLQQLRQVTAEQVGEERLIWGDSFNF
jgi:hypothetical protein